MSKQTLVASIIIILSLILGGVLGFYFYLNHKAVQSGIAPSSGGFFSFGSTPATSTPPDDLGDEDNSTTTPTVTIVPVLRHITLTPIAGSAFIQKQIFSESSPTEVTDSGIVTQKKVVGTTEVIRWVDRGNGNISETSTSTMPIQRITNTTIPQVYEADFVDINGTGVIFRGLINGSDAISTQYGVLQDTTATSTYETVKLTDLPFNITEVAVSPSGKQIFTLTNTNVRGSISNPDGTAKTTAFNSPYFEWLAAWSTPNTIYLTTKASGESAGYLYADNIKSNTITKLLGNITGLTTLPSPDGSKLLYGESQNGTFNLGVLTVKTDSTKSLYIRTLPEKCVWSKLDSNIIYCAVPKDVQYGTYPDLWYQGQIAFSDALWEINISTGDAKQILDPSTYTYQAIDMTNLSLDSGGDYLIFTNKIDLTLWGYQLTKPTTAAEPITTN